MSVMQLGTSATDKLFLEFIKPGLNIELYKNTVLYDRFKTSTDSCLGKYGIMKLLTASPKSARPSNTSTFPTALQGTYDEFKFYMKRGLYASLQFDGLALACAKGKGAVMDIIRAEVEGIQYYIGNKLNRIFWSDGSGRIALVASAVSASTTVTVDGLFHGVDSNEYTDPSQYLEEGMPVDIYNASGVKQEEDVQISTISLGAAGTDTLTMAETVTCDDNSYLFDHNTYYTADAAGTGPPIGLYGIVSTSNQTCGITSTSAFQGIDRSAYTFAQAQSFAMGGVLTSEQMLKVIHKVERYGSVDVIITNPSIWRKWFLILEADKTMPNTPAYWGGTTGLSFYGGRNKQIPVIWDEDCPDQYMYFLDSSKIKLSAPIKNGMEWIRGTNSRILTQVQGKDEFAAHLRWYFNLTTNMPRALGVLTGITHTSS